MNNVLTWKCPKCGKEIASLFERQLEQNKKAHLATHEADTMFPSVTENRKT